MLRSAASREPNQECRLPGRVRTVMVDCHGPLLRGVPPVYLTFEIEREADGRYLAEVPDLPGVLAYGATQEQAIARVQALALRVLADRLEHGEPAPDLLPIDFRAA